MNENRPPQPELARPKPEIEQSELIEEMVLLAEVLPEEIGPKGLEKFMEEHTPETLHDMLVNHLSRESIEKSFKEFARLNILQLAEAYLYSHSGEIVRLIKQINHFDKPLSDEEVIEEIIPLLDDDRSRDVQSIPLWKRLINEHPFLTVFKGFSDPAAQAGSRDIALDLAQKELKRRKGKIYEATVGLINRLRALETIQEELTGDHQQASQLHERFHRPEAQPIDDTLSDQEVRRLLAAYGESTNQPTEVEQGITI